MNDQDCIFCKIVSGEARSEMVFQDELVTVFYDINPAAPTHLLIIPNKHIASTEELGPEDAELAARMLSVVPELAAKEGLSENGYRLILNTGPHGHQEVMHMHLHLLGGHKMKHPMG